MSSKLIDVFRLLAIDMVDFLPFRFFVDLRRYMYRLAGVRIGPTACLYGRQVINFPQRLVIADQCFINGYCLFENAAEVSIGARTYVGPRVNFFTTNHDDVTMTNVVAEIRIGADCWIGGNATLLPGCILESGTTVAACAVMLRGFHRAGFYAGVPGKLKRPSPHDRAE